MNIQKANTDQLRIAAFIPTTHALGPGKRCVLYLQGCLFNCPGCVAPGFAPLEGGRIISTGSLFGIIRQIDGLKGITVSGGEPMLQAKALSPLLRNIRSELKLSVILYSGFYLRELYAASEKYPETLSVLQEVDVLVDGRYKHSLNTSQGLRGSSNQTVHFLTKRYAHLQEYFETTIRKQEIHTENGESVMVGIPTLEQWRYVALDGTGEHWYDQII